MIEILLKILKPITPQFVQDKLRETRHQLQHRQWINSGCPMPPPHRVKQLAIKAHQVKYGIDNLLETGTHLGEMIEMQKHNFQNIISIELGEELSKKATKRFAKYSHIQIIQGDSGKVLPKLMETITSKTLFWLDGHFSAGQTAKGDKECPVYEELDAIFENNSAKHIVLIDDARDFNGKGDYPSIKGLERYLEQKNTNYKLEVKDDIIRLLPN